MKFLEKNRANEDTGLESFLFRPALSEGLDVPTI